MNVIANQDAAQMRQSMEREQAALGASNPIPSEEQRPCYRVLDEPVQAADGTKYQAGVWYFYMGGGKGDKEMTLEQAWICSPLHIEAVTHDDDTNNFGRLLRFQNTLGQWRKWAMPMEMLKSDGADLRGALLSMGVRINAGRSARERLAAYLQGEVPTLRLKAVLQTGWATTDFKAFVLPDVVIGPQATRITFQSQGLHTDEYTQRGTLPGWQDAIAALAVGNPVLVLSLCCAFAGPVLALVGAEPGGVHFMGSSSTGKTSGLLAACSVWGGESYRRSWRATANGLEGTAALFNDGLLALDEISESDPRDVGEVVYMLGNGRGKARASRTGTARAVTRWRSSIISTGERSIATIMADAGQRIMAGQGVRLLDIPVQRQHGAWDALHGHESGQAFSDAIKAAVRQQYGTAGRAFLEKISRDTQNMTLRLEGIKAELMAGAGIRPSDGQPSRAATRLAVLALAGELATQYGITGWEEGEAVKAAKAGLTAWLAERGDVMGNAEQFQVLQAITDFIEVHGGSRFPPAFGHYDEKEQRIHHRAGWWRSGSSGHMQYLFTSAGLREALKGFDFKSALRVLDGMGWLKEKDPGKHAKSMRIHKEKVSVYVIQRES